MDRSSLSVVDACINAGIQRSSQGMNYSESLPRFVGVPTRYLKKKKNPQGKSPEKHVSIDMTKMSPLMLQYGSWKKLNDTLERLDELMKQLAPEQQLVLQKRMAEKYAFSVKDMHKHPIGLFFFLSLIITKSLVFLSFFLFLPFH